MKYVFITLSGLLAVSCASVLPLIPATTLVRSPQHDSAIIQSERLGGSFSYSTVEGHAYQAISPVVTNVYRPVGVSYEYRAYPSYAAYQYPLYYPQPLYTSILAPTVAPAAEQPEEARKEESNEIAPAPAAVAMDDDTVAVESA